jgi:Uma2 family endonuclease
LDGLIVDMNPIYAPHASSVEKTRKQLEQLIPRGWVVRVQQPVTLRRSEPQPDVTVARGSDEDFEERHPGPKEIALLVEVADTTLRTDRTTKARIYAAAGVPEYWIVNLVDRQVEVYRDPQPRKKRKAAGYAAQIVTPAEGVLPVTLEGELWGEIAVAHLLPRRA